MAKSFINTAVINRPDGKPYLYNNEPICELCLHRQDYYTVNKYDNDNKPIGGICRYKGCNCEIFIPQTGKPASLATWLNYILSGVPIFKLKATDQASLYYIIMECNKAKDGELMNLENAPYEFLVKLFNDDSLGKTLNDQIDGPWGPSLHGFLAMAIKNDFEKLQIVAE